MKKTILAGIVGAAIAGAIGFAAPAAQATPCSYFGDNPAEQTGICGAPDLSQSMQNAVGNLKNNFSPSNAAANASANFSPSTAAGNLEHNLTHGVGSEDQNAP
jgi:hypothetical protein